MSEFSDKLSEYIVKSGSNVYQLAKEASLIEQHCRRQQKGRDFRLWIILRKYVSTSKYPVNRKRNWFDSTRLKSWDTAQ